MKSSYIIYPLQPIALKPISSRAQVAIEFMIIVGAVIFFTSLFLLSLQRNQEHEINKRQNIQMKEIALTVQNEINLAVESSEGYSRQFEIPKKAGNMEYEIKVDSGAVFITTTDGKYALALPVPKIIGDINKTQNKIEKINGTIYLNQ